MQPKIQADRYRNLSARQRGEELMDSAAVDADQLKRALAYIRRINRALGYTRATVAHFRRFSTHWNPGERISVLDVATGSGDIPFALAGWAQRAGFGVHVIALDLHAQTLKVAAARMGTEANLLRGQALNIPLADRSVDYAMCNMFLHHLDDQQIIRCLREMDRVARRGIVVADLLREKPALRWIRLLSLFSSPMVRHDAALSVRQALNQSEALALGRQSGIDYLHYYRHFAHRFVLAGERR